MTSDDPDIDTMYKHQRNLFGHDSTDATDRLAPWRGSAN